ncbi:uncharacterized protein EAE97_003323 [Botrytis byssoidea]|uniref:Uncharacterized protein n=1 Tax=Botrytis byssoidea TaxID=139641 RepID=A0A9P5IWI0_9HELO|nr:uncharacterized protein EAE97_003323 [Botrytis byssoidea]KAF7949814.1 hypothetical protein EAE97_003323 [Botrytis byssoidea]
MASSSDEKFMSDFGHLPLSVAMVDNGDLSLSPTNPLQTSYSTTPVSASLHELVKDISTLAARLCWVKWSDHEQNPIDDLVDPLGYVTIAITLFESEEMTINKDFREPLFGEFKALLSCSKNVIALVESIEEGQTPNVRKNDEIKQFWEKLEVVCASYMALGLGAQWLKAFGPGNKTSREAYLLHSKMCDLSCLPDLVGELEETYERLDPIGYQRYLALIDVPGKEHETPAKECDEKFVGRTGVTKNRPIALHLHSKVPPRYTPPLASAKTAVNDTTSTNPEKNTGNKIHYETMTLYHVPAHIKQDWWMLPGCDLKVWPAGRKYIMEEWSLSAGTLHNAEIPRIRQRFQDAARRKMYGCGMRMEIKAGGDVEKQMREDYLRDIVDRLGEKADKTLLHLCGGGHDVFYSDDIVRRYTVEAIETRELSGIFGGPRIMGLEESLKMKKDIEFGRRKWWKKVRDFKGKEWWREGKKAEWWLEAEKVEWIVVLKVEDIDSSKRFMPRGQNDFKEGTTSISQEVRSSLGQGEENSSQENKVAIVGSVNEKKDMKKEETMGIEEAERRMRILVRRLYVEGNGDERIEG